MSGVAYVAKGDGCLVVEAPTQEEAKRRASRIAVKGARWHRQAHLANEAILRERETRRMP